MKIPVTLLLILGLINTLHATTSNNYHRYFYANYKQFKGDKKTAQDWYDKIIASHGSHHIYRGYLHFLSLTHNNAKIVALIPRLDKSFKDDAEVQLIFAKALSAVGNHKSANNKIIALSRAHKNNQEIALLATQIYMKRKEMKNALSVIDDLLNNSPRKSNNYIFYFLKSQIYIAMNKKQEALEHVKQSLELYPKFDKAWLLLALLEEESGRIDKAVKGYTSFLQVTRTPNIKIQNHLMALAIKQKVTPTQLKVVNAPASAFEVALFFTEQHHYRQALQAIDLHLKQHARHVQSKLLKIQLLSVLNQKDMVLKQLKKWILEEPTMDIWFEIAHLLSRNNVPTHKIIELLQDIEKNDSRNILPVIYLADLYIREKNMPKALNYLRKSTQISKDKKVQTSALFQMALLYHDQQKYKKMQELLLEGQQLEQNYGPLLNLLAYSYVKENKHLNEAKKLIKQALKKDKYNSHYLDTLAMVHYTQGADKKAIILLEKALKHAPQDATLLGHLGKVFAHKGDTQRALETFNEAVKLAKNEKEKTKYQKRMAQLSVHNNIVFPQAKRIKTSKLSGVKELL